MLQPKIEKTGPARLYSSLEGEVEVDTSPLVARLDGIIGDLRAGSKLRGLRPSALGTRYLTKLMAR
jgi:hypothetical protein